MNSKLLKRIIIIVDIIAVISIIFATSSYIKKSKNNNPSTSGVTYKFKMFEYNVPNNLEFSDLDDKKFQIKGDNWHAQVEIYIDENHALYDYENIFYELLKHNADSGIEEAEKVIVDQKVIVTYNKPSTKSVLCYYCSKIFPYAYEIEIYNDDNSYNTDVLNQIVDILEKATYDENDSNTYNYDVIDIEKLKQLNES